MIGIGTPMNHKNIERMSLSPPDDISGMLATPHGA